MISPTLPQVNGAELVSQPNDLDMAQPVQAFADGGLLVPFQRPFLRASDREYLEARQAEYDKYLADVGAYNTALTEWQTGVYSPYKSAVDAYNAAAAQYNTDIYNPYLSQVEAYNRAAQEYNANVYQPYQSAYDQYVKAVEAWNAGPRTSAYSGPAAPSLTPFSMQAPTQPTAFSMAQPTLERDFSMAQPVLPFKEEDITAFQKSAAERAQFDAQQRGLAIEAVSDPRKYNLSGFSVSPRMFAKGGEAKKLLSKIPVLRPKRLYDGGDPGDPSGGGGGGSDSGPGGSDLSSENTSDYSGGANGSMGFGIEGGSYAGGAAPAGPAMSPSGELGALAQAISLGLSPTGNLVSDAQVAQAVANAQMGALTPADIGALSAAGLGPSIGFNINNPTQSVQEMVAAQNVGKVLSYAAPGAMAYRGFEMAMQALGPQSFSFGSRSTAPVASGTGGATAPGANVNFVGGGGGGADNGGVMDALALSQQTVPPPVPKPSVPTTNTLQGGLEIPGMPKVMGAEVPVYSMDGRMFRNPSEAHQMGVFNYSYVPLTSLPLTAPVTPTLPLRTFAKGGPVGNARGMLDQLNRGR